MSDLIADGLEDLAVAHWEEAESDKSCPLDLDYERALAFERQGVLKIAALRRNGELVGYAQCMIMGGLFFRSTRHCYIEAIYIAPISRGLAPSFIRWVEHQVSEAGRTKIYLAAKTKRQGDFYEWLGYVFSETMFSKTVGKADEHRNSPEPIHA